MYLAATLLSGLLQVKSIVLIVTRHTLARAGLANRLLDRHEVVTGYGDVDTLICMYD